MTLAAKYAMPQLYDNSRESTDGYRPGPEQLSYPTIYTSDHDSTEHYAQTARHVEDMPKPLTTRECVELFLEGVEIARQGMQPAAGPGTPMDALRPKLTLEMSRKNIAQIPAEVVSIIKHEVERLRLSHNLLRSISSDFASCSALKYLNLRGNRFHEIPQAIFGLSQLEILDISRNDLKNVSDDIESLKVLRVLSISHNNVKDLPICLAGIVTLRMLRLDGNPWKPEIEEMIRAAEATYSPTTPARPDDSERDRHITAVIVEYLRKKQISIDEYGDSPLETPRALSRFPVNPNDSGYTTNGSDSGPGSRSPGFLKSRSHSRATSNQISASQTAGPRRPGLAPLALNNDRLRSNSESVLQATQGKTKRMGIIPKKKPELEVLEESKAHRNSFHLRGQSHSSALRNVTRANDHSPTDETSRHSAQKGTFMRRLSSVPEQRQHERRTDNVVESAKGILFALHSTQPHLTSMLALTKDLRSKRLSVGQLQKQATAQLENLDRSLQDLEYAGGQSRSTQKSARRVVCRVAHAAIAAFAQITGILMQNIQHIVQHSDRRYIRSLMLVLWGSLNEQRNARRRLQTQPAPPKTLRSLRSPSLASERSLRDDALTPTQDHPRPETRMRSGSVTREVYQHQSLAGVVHSRPTTSHSNISSRASSRSSSRAAFYYPSSATTIGTPLSGESFGSNVFPSRSRAGSVSLNPERRQAQIEHDQFERIHVTLTKAVQEAMYAIAFLEPRLSGKLEDTRRGLMPLETKDLWTRMLNRMRTCSDTSHALRQRLQSIKVNDPIGRNSQAFWQQVNRFIACYADLVDSMRPAKRYIESELKAPLLKVHSTNTDIAHLIQHSPWESTSKESLPSSQVSSRAPTPVQNHQRRPIHTQMMPPPVPITQPSMATHQQYQHRRPNGSNGSASSAVSPYNNPNIPATPLSAALGPAAQATVPKTPASASMSEAFQGDVFQRAEYFLQGQSAQMARRPSGVAP